MRALLPAVIAAAFILMLWVALRLFGGWRRLHQRLVGGLVLIYGAYLATLTGTVTQLVLPGIGAVGGGAVAGAGVGLITYAIVGTVGVVTGGAGWAVGAGLMALLGAGLGAVGGSAGAFGFRTVTYPLVSPFFWIPIVFVGVYMIFGARKNREIRAARAESLPPPDASEGR